MHRLIALLCVLGSWQAGAPAVADEGETCKPAAIVGKWGFTTRVSSAKNKSLKGANGYYQLQVSQNERCELTAKVTKTGYGKVRLTGDKVLEGRGRLEPVDPYSERQSWVLDATIRSTASNSVKHLGFFFSYREDKTLDGWFVYLRESYQESNVHGVLQGARNRTSRTPLASDRQISCDVKCTLKMCFDEWVPIYLTEFGGLGESDPDALRGFVNCDEWAESVHRAAACGWDDCMKSPCGRLPKGCHD